MTSEVVKMRKALEVVTAFKNAGILFVPMPVIGQDDHDILVEVAAQRLKKLQEVVKAND